VDEIILNGKYESKSYHEAIPTAYRKDCIIRSQLRALLPTQVKPLINCQQSSCQNTNKIHAFIIVTRIQYSSRLASLSSISQKSSIRLHRLHQRELNVTLVFFVDLKRKKDWPNFNFLMTSVTALVTLSCLLVYIKRITSNT